MNKDKNIDDGFYHFDYIEKDEEKLIMDIIIKSNCSEYKSLEFYYQANMIVHKCRYILFQLLILKYENSVSLYDQLVVGIAYKNKGAFYRPMAIKYLEMFIKQSNSKTWNIVERYLPKSSVFLILSELYEKEYDFNNAIEILSNIKVNDCAWSATVLKVAKILKKVDINRCVDYCETALLEHNSTGALEELNKFLIEARQLQDRKYVYRPRKNRAIEENKEIEDEIEETAKKFLKYFKN